MEGEATIVPYHTDETVGDPSQRTGVPRDVDGPPPPPWRRVGWGDRGLAKNGTRVLKGWIRGAPTFYVGLPVGKGLSDCQGRGEYGCRGRRRSRKGVRGARESASREVHTKRTLMRTYKHTVRRGQEGSRVPRALGWVVCHPRIIYEGMDRGRVGTWTVEESGRTVS